MLNLLVISITSTKIKTSLFQITTSDEPDTLYKRLSILVKAHDKAVLDSYEYFAVLAAKELGISINVWVWPFQTWLVCYHVISQEPDCDLSL